MRARLQFISFAVFLACLIDFFPAHGKIACAAACAAARAAARAAETVEEFRQEFRSLIVAGRTPLPIIARIDQSIVENGLRFQSVVFKSEPTETIYLHVYYSEKQDAKRKRPVLIWQHWLGGRKDHPLLVELLKESARRGFMAVAMDGRFRGERNHKDLETAMIDALQSGMGHPWLIDTVYDLTRLVDYLQTRDDVDIGRIGLTGISEGGFESWMVAAIDTRIAVVAPIIGVTRWSKDDNPVTSVLSLSARVALLPRVYEAARKQLGEDRVNARVIQFVDDRLLPGMRDRFDPAKIVPLIAPRPLLILNHEKDMIVPLEGARFVFAAAKKRYEKMGSVERIRMRVAPGLHHEARDDAELKELFDWMQKWLLNQ